MRQRRSVIGRDFHLPRIGKVRRGSWFPHVAATLHSLRRAQQGLAFMRVVIVALVVGPATHSSRRRRSASIRSRIPTLLHERRSAHAVIVPARDAERPPPTETHARRGVRGEFLFDVTVGDASIPPPSEWFRTGYRVGRGRPYLWTAYSARSSRFRDACRAGGRYCGRYRRRSEVRSERS
jgi:hypothetical protein